MLDILKIRRLMGWMLGGILLANVIASCAPGNTDAGNANGTSPVTLTLVSYAVTQRAYGNIIPKFTQQWQEKTGQSVTIEQSYGGSGSQTRAVIDGLEADVVALAIPADTEQIEKAGLLEPGWQEEYPNGAIVHKSVAALIKRDEQVPVQGWSDLARDDVQVITANPKTSGGARWNFLALWGSVTQAGGSEQEAEAFVEQVMRNVPVMPKDAREATEVFYQQNQGDVLINYENELLLAKEQGQDLPYIIPTDYNISIDNPIAVVDANVDKHGTREVAEAFVEFLYTPEAQREFAKVGFRPVDETVAQEFANQYPEIENLFTSQDIGSWDEIDAKFFADGAIFDQVITRASAR